MFTKSTRFYDAVYGFKDYAGESEQLLGLIKQYKSSDGNALLDVACGTGGHIPYLQEHFQIEGLDLDENMLVVARERFPDIPFHQGDMVDFELNGSFDVIICLFSSIGYAKTESRMRQAVQTMADHLIPGGVLILEPWISPDQWKPGDLHGLNVVEPDFRITRMNISETRDNLSFVEFHYLVGTPEGIHYFTEEHELGLFPTVSYLDALQNAGLDVIHDPEGLIGRGLFIGMKPAS